MNDFSKHEKWAQVYAVERTVEVVVSMQGEAQTIRIEALRSSKTGRYSSRAYLHQQVALQPAPVDTGEAAWPVDQPILAPLWLDLRPTLPLTNEATADEAIERALESLSQRCD